MTSTYECVSVVLVGDAQVQHQLHKVISKQTKVTHCQKARIITLIFFWSATKIEIGDGRCERAERELIYDSSANTVANLKLTAPSSANNLRALPLT